MAERDVPRGAEQAGCAGHVEKGLVDRDALDQGGEVAEHLHDLISQALILPEVPGHEAQAGTEPAGGATGHSRSDTESPGFVGGGQHDTPSDGQRTATERWVQELFHRGVKGVEVGVEDRRAAGCLH